MSEAGFDEWAGRVSRLADEDLVDASAGAPIRWQPGKGWLGGKG